MQMRLSRPPNSTSSLGSSSATLRRPVFDAPLSSLGGWLRAYFPDQRLVIEPTAFLFCRIRNVVLVAKWSFPEFWKRSKQVFTSKTVIPEVLIGSQSFIGSVVRYPLWKISSLLIGHPHKGTTNNAHDLKPPFSPFYQLAHFSNILAQQKDTWTR